MGSMDILEISITGKIPHLTSIRQNTENASTVNQVFVINGESIVTGERRQRFRNAGDFTPDIQYMFIPGKYSIEGDPHIFRIVSAGNSTVINGNMIGIV